jgi:hypothetical protein
MANRREFKKSVKVEIVKRAIPIDIGAGARLRPNPEMAHCEKCGLSTKGRFEIDHRDPDAMQIDKSKPLTAADGWLLCLPCHDEKTAKDVADIAKAKRREAAHLGAKRDKQPIPQRAKGEKPIAKAPVPGRPGIARQFVNLGDVASGVLTKLNPKKAAE